MVPFRLTQSRISVPSPQRRRGVQVTFFDPSGPSDFPELRSCAAACLWMARIVPRSLLVTPMGGAVHGRRGRAPKTPTLLDVVWVRGRLKLQNHERSLPRVLDSNLRVTASPTRVSLGVASCQSEILSLETAVWRLWLVSKSRTMSSAKGCEQLLRRVASLARPPFSPSHARTALSRTICGRI